MKKELLRRDNETFLAWIKRLHEMALAPVSFQHVDPLITQILVNHIPTLVELAERSESPLERPSSDILGMNRDELISEIKRLQHGIRQHRDEKGNGRCWLDDRRLYALLPETAAETQLPPKNEFLRNCDRYWETRQQPEQKAASMNASQKAKFDDWLSFHQSGCEKAELAFSERFDFKFAETGVGTAVTVVCACGVKADLTDYENW